MKIDCVHQGRTTVFRVAGRIVGHSIVELCKRLEALDGGRCDKVVVDLAGVNQVDSCGLGGLLYTHRILQKSGLEMVLACAAPELRLLFADCNFDSVVPVVDSY